MLANTRLLMSCSKTVPAQQAAQLTGQLTGLQSQVHAQASLGRGQAHLDCPAVGCITERQSCSLLLVLLLLLQVHAGQAHEQEGKALPHGLAVLVQVCKVAPLLDSKVAALCCFQAAA